MAAELAYSVTSRAAAEQKQLPQRRSSGSTRGDTAATAEIPVSVLNIANLADDLTTTDKLELNNFLSALNVG